MYRVALLALLGSSTGPALAQDTPPGLVDLVGARAGQVEGELTRRGYALVRTQPSEDRNYSYYYSQTYGRCVIIATANGRYDSIVETPVPDCRTGGGTTTLPSRPPSQGGVATTLPAYPVQPIVVGGQSIDLALVCYGDGQRPSFARRPGYVWNPRTDRYEYSDRSELTSQVFETQLTVQLWNGGGRIRLPRQLTPPIHSGGVNGWWPLYDVVSNRNQIAARYRMNSINKPRLVIDRRSGRISMTGVGNYNFRGTCDQIDGRDRRF